MTPAPTETPSPIPTTPSTDAHQPPDRFGAHTRLLTTTKKRRLLLPLTPLAHAPPARQPRPPHPAPQPPHLKPRSFFLSVRISYPSDAIRSVSQRNLSDRRGASCVTRDLEVETS